MKDKTDSMNRGYSSEEGESGFDKIPDSEVPTRKQYKDRQLKCAGLLENEALEFQEDMDDENSSEQFGFIPRSNIHDRY